MRRQTPNPKEWNAIREAIQRGAALHRAECERLIKEAIDVSECTYVGCVDELAQSITGPGALGEAQRPMMEHLSAYLRWLRWCGWNAAQLTVLSPGGVHAAARRLGFGMVAYAAGRLMDDGIDDHQDFKGHHETVVGWLRRHQEGENSCEPRTVSVFLGFGAVTHALRRARVAGEHATAAALDAVLKRIIPGVIAEPFLSTVPSACAYRFMVRRKAGAYNMLLYVPPMIDLDAALRWRLFRALLELDHVAQVINDLEDVSDDVRRGAANAISSGVHEPDELRSIVQQRVGRLWAGIAAFPNRPRAVLTAMLADVRLDAAEGATRAGRRATTDPINRDEVVAAIHRGLSYLSASQKLTGEFPAYYSKRVDMAEPTYRESPFFTAMVLLAIGGLDAEQVDGVRKCALGYLAGKRRANGLVHFLNEGIDADLDDTCLVNWLLASARIAGPYEDLGRMIQDAPRSNGLFATWVRPGRDSANDTDPCVNVNVLRLLAQCGRWCRDTADKIRQLVRSPKRLDGTLYYRPAGSLLYLLGTLRPEVRARVIPAEEWRHCCDELLRIETRTRPGVVDVAMALTLWRESGWTRERIAIHLRWLLSRQQRYGGWPAEGVFRAFNNWGSRELTTAIVLQGLHATLHDRTTQKASKPPVHTWPT